jgi:hypothetical protein
MAITLNGSGTITGVSSLATALVNPIVTTTMGVGNATPAVSGAGITFPAAVSASSNANTLDDYEEGAWSPTMVGSTVAGTTTYSVQSATYTKIGNVVTIQGYVTWTNATGTGNIKLGNLPFTANSTYYCHILVNTNNITLTASNTCNLMETDLNGNEAFIYQSPVGGGTLTAVAMDTSGALYFGGSYVI